jgi:hypothetical protein
MPGGRQRRQIGRSDRACGVCAAVGMTIIESRAVRRGADRLNPLFDPAIKRYELCRACGTKHPLQEHDRV